MIISYYDKPEQSDPCQANRYLHIKFDKPEEIAALNQAGTAEYILAYARVVMTQFLKENAGPPQYLPPYPDHMYVPPEGLRRAPRLGSQLERGRSE